MTRKRLFIISFIVLLLAVSSSLYASATDKDTGATEQKRLITMAGDIEISESEFEFYKANIKLINQLNEAEGNFSFQTGIPSDQELVDEMLKKRLSVQYARNSGITVDEDEIIEVVNREKSILNSSNLDIENQALIQEIMKQRIKLTGLSEEDFWKSDFVHKEYESVLYIDKLFKDLMEKEEISNIQDFEKLQIHLLEQYKNTSGEH